ncbi:putative Prepilin-type N-terminal cleavage/methylation domain-containing protein [Burkholderiales bacterium]|nr:putative Prepilin-type N-terminal cleavage/methylation domain-containing protein [Burkholderiales bacterium]
MTPRAQLQQEPAARGFTLTDLLIAVAIVAILAAIAIPSYSVYIVRAQRAAAKAVLLQTSQAMERYYTVNGAYADGFGNFPLPILAGTAACVAVSPMDSNTTTYCISGANTATGGFLLTATPCGDGAGCPATANLGFTDAQCDQLTIDNTGAKGDIVGGAAAGPAVVDQCWQR